VAKTGNDFKAFFSPDGTNWRYGGLVGADFWGDYYVGLESLSATLTAPPVLFDNVSAKNANPSVLSGARHQPGEVHRLALKMKSFEAYGADSMRHIASWLKRLLIKYGSTW
jgi:hypothetical protein